MIFDLFKFRRSLKTFGVLGNNARLRNYILPNNKRKSFPLVDDKIKTTNLLSKRGIPYPQTYECIESIGGTKDLHFRLKNLKSFVVKPARGAAGNGILLVSDVHWSENKKDTYVMTNRKEKLKYDEFIYYISMILSGVFSLSGHKDRVLIQEKLNVHSFFDPISYKGIPDIRVIVFRGFPIMAMVRLPTKVSGGRGNLHQGALGCGVDLRSGEIQHAVLNNKSVSRHPDFLEIELKGLKIPGWNKVLKVASMCSEDIDIEYLGVDIVLDPDRGPLVLEMNARPGLSIQLANQKGLEGPLEKVESLVFSEMTLEQKIEFAQENF